jgi:hypothetical protein
MLKNKLVTNKFYTYSGVIVKLKKISKKQNRIYVERLDNNDCHMSNAILSCIGYIL